MERTFSETTLAPGAALGFVRIEGGTFSMGDGEGNAAPVRSVTVSGFSMCKHLVTQREWYAMMGNNPSKFKGDDLPVESVIWQAAIEYANKLSQKEGLVPAYTMNGNDIIWDRSANGYRLSTEAEWEYAARGGNGSPEDFKYSGSDDVDKVAWYGKNSAGSTQPVGQKAPNTLGLYDMSGNVWEWCWDKYAGKYPSLAETDPTGATSSPFRVLRGGGWSDSARHVRCASRVRGLTSYQFSNRGFRLVRSLLGDSTSTVLDDAANFVEAVHQREACIECGATFFSSDSMFCWNCGAKYLEDAAMFCSRCGVERKVPESKDKQTSIAMFCNECGRPFDSNDSNFCNECGTKR